MGRYRKGKVKLEHHQELFKFPSVKALIPGAIARQQGGRVPRAFF
ncbi:MAG: hypothetical protein ACK4OF_05785 [Aquificaceae bacterium]